jgi:hypothetical protein
MKKQIMCAALAASAGLASADVYGDATGEIFDLGFAHLDIASVTLTNDADWLYISVQTTGDLDNPNWGKYAIGINNGKDASDAGNGWGRNIDWGGQTITHWSATWADDGGTGVGGEIYNFSGGWNLIDATYGAGTEITGDDSQHTGGVQMWALSLSSLNLEIGDTFTFDVITTGGGDGDPGVDHLSRSDQATPFWDTQSVAGEFLSYTVVPAPGAIALLGIGGLVAARRRR